MDKLFLNSKENIQKFLFQFLFLEQKKFSSVNRWGEDVFKRLSDFSTKGKMIRGGLFMIANRMFNREINDDAIKIATALELFQSSFLIHDDIMDNDELRRGSPTIFAQYKEIGLKEGFCDFENFGKNMGISVGDIGFFLAFKLLNNLDADKKIKQKIIQNFSDEFIFVGLAQMQDVYLGNSSKIPDEEDIISVYLYKTARYTFSLPLTLGAILNNQPQKTVNNLSSLGEYLGLIFQIKDDEMGIFGEEKITGKPIGSDIREGKKTLFYYHLFKNSSEKERENLKKIFGKKNMDKKMFTYIISEIKRLNVKENIDMKLKDLEEKTKKIIINLEIEEDFKTFLNNFLKSSLKRKS